MATTKKQKRRWFFYGVIGILLAAPNGTFIKLGTNQLDPLVFNTLRHLIVAIIATPFIWRARKKISPHAWLLALCFGLCMSVAVICYAQAIKLSNASYPSIIMLLSPIVFIVLSTLLTRDSVNTRQIAGITLAALGAFLVIGVPLALSQSSTFTFYPAATVYMLINVIAFPLGFIFSKKTHATKAPLKAIMGISFWVITIVNGLLASEKIGQINLMQLQPVTVFSLTYTSIIVAFVARDLGIRSYEHLGSGVSSALEYGETLLSVTIPVLFLGEQLSLELVAGGALILLGVYIAEHHRAAHRHDMHVLRNH